MVQQSASGAGVRCKRTNMPVHPRHVPVVDSVFNHVVMKGVRFFRHDFSAFHLPLEHWHLVGDDRSVTALSLVITFVMENLNVKLN